MDDRRPQPNRTAESRIQTGNQHSDRPSARVVLRANRKRRLKRPDDACFRDRRQVLTRLRIGDKGGVRELSAPHDCLATRALGRRLWLAAGDGIDAVDRTVERQDDPDAGDLGLSDEVGLSEVEPVELVDLERSQEKYRVDGLERGQRDR